MRVLVFELDIVHIFQGVDYNYEAVLQQHAYALGKCAHIQP